MSEAIDRYIREQMRERRIPGLGLVVVGGGAVLKLQAYGLASVELDVPATVRTVFRLASLTKIFTATAIMTLVEDGAVSLDHSIARLLPELPAAWSDVTVQHCLAHASGLPDAVNKRERPIAYSLDEVLHLLADMPRSPPGTENSYNQTGFLVLGMIIARVTGMAFEEYIHRRLLEPLGMRDAAFGDDRDIVMGRTSMYTVIEPSDDRLDMKLRDDGPVLSLDRMYATSVYVYPRFEFSCAGLNCSVEDIARWERALSLGQALSPELLESMAHPIRLRDGAPGHYGAGWLAGKMDHRRTMAFGGGGATWHLRLPEERLSVVVLANLQRSDPASIAEGVARLCLEHG